MLNADLFSCSSHSSIFIKMSEWDVAATAGSFGDQFGGGQSGGVNHFGGGQFDDGHTNGFDQGDQGFGATDGGNAGGGGACYNCGKDGYVLCTQRLPTCYRSLLIVPSHNKADCPEPRVIRCRHCNEEGHYISQCPDPTCPPQEPREFTGECHSCGQEGHRAAECPDRGPILCNNCKQEGTNHLCMRVSVLSNQLPPYRSYGCRLQEPSCC